MHVSEDVCREKREEAEAEMSKKNKNPTQRMWGKTHFPRRQDKSSEKAYSGKLLLEI